MKSGRSKIVSPVRRVRRSSNTTWPIRMLGILIGLCLGVAAGAAGYYLLKLLG